MDHALLDLLRTVDTPTVCNAIEVAQGRRGFAGFTRGTPVATAPGEAMVGYAVTAKLSALEPPREEPAAIRARRMAYYKAIWDAPKPAVAVIEDLDAPDCIGAFWGEVNSNVHKGLGCLGCVTSGSFRDLDMLAPGFQIIGGMVNPSHAHVHVVDFGGEVEVHGMPCAHDEVVHADRHGSVVIPAEAVRQLPAAIDLITRKEAVILDMAKRDDFNIEKLKDALSRSEDIH